MSLADRIEVMHGGVIEQYASPAQVYHKPATEFVGGFIGNPPMNFINRTAAWADLGVTPPVGAHTLGIRPEDLELAPAGLIIHPLVVEMLGASQQITAKLDDAALRVSIDNTIDAKAGQAVTVLAKAGKASWYDAQGNLMGS
jgi:multiple sugar transport system ATP-binding protein